VSSTATELKVIVWDNFSDTDGGTTFIADYNNIRLDKDSKVVALAFVPGDTTVSMPPSAPNIPELGAVDDNQLTPEQPVDGDQLDPEQPADSTQLIPEQPVDSIQLTPEQPVDDSDG